MPAINQTPIGIGQILWLGVNQMRKGFSVARDMLTVHDDGIDSDRYRGMWREISGHDVDYVATDGVVKDDSVLNLRQITIVEEGEVAEAGRLSGIRIMPGMLRENIVVQFYPTTAGQKFSALPPLSRMVIGYKAPDPKVLLLTEQNRPCQTICNPIVAHYDGDGVAAVQLRGNLRGRRGQMAMVRSGKAKTIYSYDSFVIFPPMT